LKPLLVVLATAAALALAACGGNDDDAAPLALEQRVASAQDAPDSKPDPVEKRITAQSTRQFIERMGDAFINPTQEDRTEFEESGFLRAIRDTRFIPETPGGPHTPEAPHIFTLVSQFESEDGAETGLDLGHRDSLRPCPERCAQQVSEFDVDGVPDAFGVRRYATAESLEETGEEGEPHDSYEIHFADGPFAYRITLSGGIGEVSEEELEEIARRLYERVAGAPALA
jgi:hypothetical protein